MHDLIGPLLLQYELPAIFFGAFFFGETVIITAAFLSGQGVWSILNVFWLAFLGTIASDLIWFLLGHSIYKYLKNWQNYQDKYQPTINKLQKITGDKPFLALLFIKFLYGTRILTILYLSTRKIGFKKFVFYDAIGTIIWLAVLLPIGWLAGKGIGNYIKILDNTEYTLLVIVAIVIILRLITIWLKKLLTKK